MRSAQALESIFTVSDPDLADTCMCDFSTAFRGTHVGNMLCFVKVLGMSLVNLVTEHVRVPWSSRAIETLKKML